MTAPAALQPLFRPEAVATRRSSAIGGIRLGHRPGHGAVAAGALLVAAALLAFAAKGEVTRKARVPGVLAPVLGSLPLVAVGGGVLLERRVEEGDAVVAGQVLFVVGTDRVGPEGAAGVLLAARLDERRHGLQQERRLRVRQVEQRRAMLSERLRGLQSERDEARHEAALAEARTQLSRHAVDRDALLAAQGYVSTSQRQAREEDLLDRQARVRGLRRGALALERELRGVERELRSLDVQRDTELVQLDRQLALLAQEGLENQTRRLSMLVAPRDGTVGALAVDAGAAVAAGQTLATLLPPSPLEARLYAPSRTAGFVQPGQAVWLRYAAYPYQKFGMARGTVASVSRTPLAPQDLPAGQQAALQQATRSAEPLYRIGVSLEAQHVVAYGRAVALKPGMALDADVVQDRRSVGEWMLEPLLSVRAGRLPVTPVPPAVPVTATTVPAEMPPPASVP